MKRSSAEFHAAVRRERAARGRGCEEGRDAARMVGDEIEVLAGALRVAQHRDDAIRGSRVGPRSLALLARRGRQRLQFEARRRIRLLGGTCLGEPRERARELLLRCELLLVRHPRIVGEHPPVFGRERVAAAGGGRRAPPQA